MVRSGKVNSQGKGEKMEFYVLRIEEKSCFVIGDNVEDAILKWIVKRAAFNRALDMTQLGKMKYAVRVESGHKRLRISIKDIDALTYPEYCKRFENEVAERKPCFNRMNAWKYYYPDGQGKTKQGYALHHKDESLKHGNPTRYNMWLPEDLVMMTRSEHQRHHAKRQKASAKTRELLRQRMLGNTNNRGKHWFNNGEVNVRMFEAPEGFVSGLLIRKK